MKRKNIYFLIGTICILVAAFIFAKNTLEDYEVNKTTQSITEQLIKDDDDASKEKGKYLKNPKMEMPVKEIDGHEYIGYVKIKRLGLKLPIMSSWSYEKIKISPARYQGSVYEDNMVLLAHNYHAHFGKLYQLEKNDEIVFYDMDDNEFVFKVKDKEEIRGDKLDELLSGEWDLTLFTCTLSGEFRTVIRCDLVDEL